jgi:hypothetical protein
MSDYLMVPIQLDALYVKNEELGVIPPDADFSRIPYFDRLQKTEINEGIPYISEAIVSQPFQSESLHLSHGIHLHWAMPDSLTRGDSTLNFPLVPNVWLVTRRYNKQVSMQWIVESDYLYPPGVNKHGTSISIPYHSTNYQWKNDRFVFSPEKYQYRKSLLLEILKDETNRDLVNELTNNFFVQSDDSDILILKIDLFKSSYPSMGLSSESRLRLNTFIGNPLNRSNQPFRYMGRKLTLDAWLNDDHTQNEYYPDLSAIGYGDPAFAALYPSCFSVFGLHDDHSDLERDSNFNINSIQYDIAGWYRDESNDQVAVFKNIYDTLKKDEKPEPFSQALLEKFKWKLPSSECTPKRILCYAGISFECTANTPTTTKMTADVSITVANTPTEALSVCIADKLSNNDFKAKELFEQQLEALQLSTHLDKKTLDVQSRFDQLRHENGFISIDSGFLWTIHKETKTNGEISHDNLQSSVNQYNNDELPVEIAHALAEVNRLQQEYDQSWHEIESMRRQLFADWYKYMICVYPPKETLSNDYPEPDLVKCFIENKILDELEHKILETGTILDRGEQHDTFKEITPSADNNPSSTANRLCQAFKVLTDLIETAKDKVNEKNKTSAIRYSITNMTVDIIKEQISQTDNSKLQQIQSTIDQLINKKFNIETLIDTLSPFIDLKFYDVTKGDFFNSLSQTCGSYTIVNFTVERIPAPRFWQPSNPVILIEGDIVTPTMRHGQDGELICSIFNAPEPKNEEPVCSILNTHETKWKFVTAVADEINRKRLQCPLESSGDIFAFKTWTSQPWNPILLEWRVQLHASDDGSNLTSDNALYHKDYICRNHFTAPPCPDLQMRTDQGSIDTNAQFYSGVSILSPQAQTLLSDAIERELTDRLKTYSDVKALKADINNFNDKLSDSAKSNPVETMKVTYKILQDIKILSQSMNGFNNALIMQKQTLELPVEDPLGFQSYRFFSDLRVHNAMDTSIKSAPSPSSKFNPIRSGCMKIDALRLVDTFGQVCNLDVSHVKTSTLMTTRGNPGLITLPPRIVQPVRLQFRWLSAENNHETNSHQATSPICGWLICNKFDNTIMFYNASGKALGYFTKDGWNEAIASDEAIPVHSNIKNEQLKKIAAYINNLISVNKPLLTQFIDAIDNALENIHPEKDTGIDAPSLFIGKPIAVVRASLSLQLCGNPVVNQGWNAFRQDLNGHGRTDDNFTLVQFPVRLGEYEQLNDGMIGYWLENSSDSNFEHSANFSRQVFFSPQNSSIKKNTDDSQQSDSTKSVNCFFDDNYFNFSQSIADTPQNIVMLMDVQGSVRATMGIVPCKEITIPPEHYIHALKNLEISFQHAPIITQQRKIDLTLRPVHNFAWSWVEKIHTTDGKGNTWKEIAPGNWLYKSDFIEKWQDVSHLIPAQVAWDYLLSKNISWLKIAEIDNPGNAENDTTVNILESKDRKAQVLGQFVYNSIVYDFNGLEFKVEELFDCNSTGVVPMRTDAVFTGLQEIREGWLKLRSLQDN